MLQTFCEGKEVYVYGTGIYGKRAINELRNAGCTVKAAVVSNSDEAGEEMNGINIISVDELLCATNPSNTAIIVALKPCFREEVAPRLKQSGFVQLLMYPFDV